MKHGMTEYARYKYLYRYVTHNVKKGVSIGGYVKDVVAGLKGKGVWLVVQTQDGLVFRTYRRLPAEYQKPIYKWTILLDGSIGVTTDDSTHCYKGYAK